MSDVTKPIGKVSIVPKGAWSSSTTYTRLDLVTYQGGSYLAIIDNTNVSPTTTSTWLKIAEKGDKGDPAATADVQAWLRDNVAPISSILTLPNWSSTDTYAVNNVVLYTTNNKIYRCHTAVETAGTLPTDINYWSEVVATSIIDSSLSTPGAAADAAAVGNLKSALTANIKNLNSILKLDFIQNFNFVEGCGLTSLGVINVSSAAKKRITTVEFIDISAAIPTDEKIEQLSYSITDGYRLYVAYYTSPSEADFSSVEGWLTGTGTLTPTGSYMRICYASVGDSTTLTAADADKITITLYPKIKSVLDEALSFKDIVSIDSAYSDVDQIFEYGMFAVYETAINIPIAARGTLLVMPIGFLDQTSGLYRYRKIQVFITCTTTAEKNILMRYMTNSRTWSVNWTKVIDYSIYDSLNAVLGKTLTDSGFTAANFQSGGISESGTNASNSNRIRTAGYVDVQGYDSIQYSITDGYRMNVVFFSTNASGNNIFYSTWLTGNGVLMFPEGTKYYRASYASIGDSTALTTDDYDKVTIKYGTALTDIANPIVKRTKWLALGDSITYGIYSTGPNTEVTNTYGWVQRLAAALGYDLTTMASRGMGYTVTGQDPLNSSDPRIDIATLVSRATALTTDFNLITLAFGINDYNTSSTVLTNVQSSLAATITSMLTAFPKARLAVITPFNCTKEGNASTKYAYGAAHDSYTLKQLADAIKETCDTFGVECIYASDGFLLNTINITTLLPDGIHPSYEAHDLIAKNMAHFLLN